MVEHVLQIDSECVGSGGQTLLRVESRGWGARQGLALSFRWQTEGGDSQALPHLQPTESWFSS